jgi:hypothetical protein
MSLAFDTHVASNLSQVCQKSNCTVQLQAAYVRERAKPLMGGQWKLIWAGCCVLVVVLCFGVVARAIIGTLTYRKINISQVKRLNFLHSEQKIPPNHPNESECSKSSVFEDLILFGL